MINKQQILAQIRKHIESDYLGFSEIADWETQWSQLEAQAMASPSEEEFHQIVGHFVEQALPLSHTMLITPEIRKQLEAQNQGEAPDFMHISHRVTDQYCYIKIPSFVLPLFSIEKVTAPLRNLDPSVVVILDLRLNSGGSASAAGDLLGCFVGADKAFLETRTLNYRDLDRPVEVYPIDEKDNKEHQAEIDALVANKWQLLKTPKEPRLRVENPVLVLVGARSYSCGEVFPQAMKEFGRAQILGQKTAGAVVGARDDFDCGDGYSLLLPFVNLVTAKGFAIEGVGVTPDREMVWGTPDTEPLTDDEVMALLK